MSHWLTERCGLLPAPAGLAVVQDLLNTRKISDRGVDLLDTVDLAGTWLPDVLGALAEADRPAADTHRPAADTPGLRPTTDWLGELDDRDLAGLRTLRSDLVRSLASGMPPSGGKALTKSALELAPDGRISLQPTGSGWHRLASSIWIEVFLAQQNGSWQRLKVCRNEVCGSTFFDRSKNNSGVWHDVKVCGNAANLRASRARKRLAGVTADAPAAPGPS